MDFTIPYEEVLKTYQAIIQEKAVALTQAIPNLSQPAETLITQTYSWPNIYNLIISKLIPPAYKAALKTENIKPIMLPKIIPIKIATNEPWLIKVTSCETPQFDLGDYMGKVKQMKVEKNLTGTIFDNKVKGQFINEAMGILVSSTNIDIPPMLLAQQIDRLVELEVYKQQQMRLTFDQYLKSINKNFEQFRYELIPAATNLLKMELIMIKIAKDQKLVEEPPEPSYPPDPNQPPPKDPVALQQERQQKVIEFLVSL